MAERRSRPAPSQRGQRALELAIGDQRWALQGGFQEQGLLGLRIAVLNGADVVPFTVRVPIDIEAAEGLKVGEVEVVEGWPE